MTFRLLLTTLLALAWMPSIANAQKASGPEVGAPIKDFSLQDQHGKPQKLSGLLSEGPIALVVLRSAGWCTHCKDQLVQLQSDLDSIESSGLRIVGLSYDKVEVLQDFASLNKIQFPLLSDPESEVIQQLRIVNTARKKGTLRYRVAHPMTIVINSDSTVASVIPGDITIGLHNAKQLLDAWTCLLYTSPSPRDATLSRMPSSA